MYSVHAWGHTKAVLVLFTGSVTENVAIIDWHHCSVII